MPAQMTSQERILAAIRHEEADRVPISPRIWAFLMSYYGAKSWLEELRAAEEFGYDPWIHTASPVRTIQELDMAYRDLADEVRVRQEVVQEGGGVSVKRTFETPAGRISDETFSPPPGGDYGVDPSPTKRSHLIKTPDDLAAMRYILPAPTRASFQSYHAIARAVGQDGFVDMTMNLPLDHFLGDARGMEQLMMDYYLDRPFFDSMLALFQDYALEVLKAALEQGVRAIFGTWYYASLSAGWSPRIFRECFTPLMRKQAELVHSYDGIYGVYDDGKMMATLADYASAGADVIETLTPPPVGDVDLAEAKRLYGAQTCLKGHIDLLYVIKMGTPELIEDRVREAIEVAAPGGGFVLGTSDSIREGTPLENVRAYFAAAHRYGAYGR